MKKLALVLLCSSIFFSCRQINKSIDQTLHPVDSLVKKKTEKQMPPVPAPVDVDALIDSNIKMVDSSVQAMVKSITKGKVTINTSVYTRKYREHKKTGFLTDALRLDQAEQALKKLPQYAGKEIFFYSSVNFYDDGRIVASLRHPENPKYVDRYEYSGGAWSAPKPEQLSVRDNVQSRLLSLNKFSFSDVAKVTRTYNEKAAAVEGAKQSTTTYISIWDNQLRWFPGTINGSRERYSIQFNTDGTLKSYRQD
jgi:hypothetical protein